MYASLGFGRRGVAARFRGVPLLPERIRRSSPRDGCWPRQFPAHLLHIKSSDSFEKKRILDDENLVRKTKKEINEEINQIEEETKKVEKELKKLQKSL